MEIGTAKIVVIIGEIVAGQSVNIIGFAESSSAGVRKGQIWNFKEVSNAVHATIAAAEKSAQITCDIGYLAQTGRHLAGFRNFGTARVSGTDGCVSQRDVARALEEAKRKELGDDRVYIHHILNPFRLDGRLERDPIGLTGHHLEAGYWSVHGNELTVRDAIRVLNHYGMDVADMIISSIASGVMVASETDKEAGCLVLDVGCGTTDYAVYHDGYIVKTGVVSVGGDHLTNDLAMGLRINRKLAEKLKVEEGRATVDKADRKDPVWLVGDLTIGDRQIPRYAINQILHARMEELFQIIRDDLGPLGSHEQLAAGCFLTGGTARLPGIADVGRQVLGLDVHLGEPPGWIDASLRRPEYTTAIGLLHYALTGQEQQTENHRPRGILRRISRMFADA
ncbi:MAG: cell division protein FtsA [Opitutales bacterium]